MMQRFILAILVAGGMLACDGTASQRLPPGESTEPGTTNPERPTDDPERPTTDPERPTGNPETPVSSPVPGDGVDPNAGNGGRGGDDTPPGRAGGNSGPGNECTVDSGCSCDNNCDTCHCAGLDDSICDALCP